MGDHKSSAEEEEERWEEHLAHYAHEMHLAAEWAEEIERSVHVAHIAAAAKLLKAHGQMAWDLRRMARGIRALENVAKQGGRKGAKAAQQLIKAKAAFNAAKSEFEAERNAVSKASALIQKSKLLRAELLRDGDEASRLLRLGESVTEFENALRTSRIGSKLLTVGRVVGRIATNKIFVRGLIVVAVAIEAVESYVDSTAQTKAGKTANAALGAGASLGIMASPVLTVIDLIAPKEAKPSVILHGGMTAVTAVGEGFISGDTRAMDEFHKRSMQGHYGKVMQAASEAGEFWAEKGIGGGLREFADAVRWWMTVDDTVTAPVIDIPPSPESI
jgi:hypothetical protein